MNIFRLIRVFYVLRSPEEKKSPRLDLVCAEAWQTLATVSPSVPLVRSTKTRLSLCHQLARLYVTKLPTPTSTTTLQQCSIQSTSDSLLRTALALQHLAHVRLAVRASNQIDTPPPGYPNVLSKTGTSIYQPRPTSASCYDRLVAFDDSTDTSFPQWLSSCILRHDRPQLPATIVQLHSTTRPTSASRDDRPAAFYYSTDSYPHQTSSCILTHFYDSTIPAIDITHLAEDQIQSPRTLHTRL